VIEIELIDKILKALSPCFFVMNFTK